MMIFKKLSVVAALSLSSLALVAGCASATDDVDDVGEGESDLSAAGKALIGSYTDDSGTFRGLILTATKAGQANEFIADVSTGIVCVTTPCPSSERITGTFTAGTKTINLKSSTASQHSQHILGRYNYTVQGDKLSLSRKNFAQSLEKVGSYCSQSSDCYTQSIIHPMCLGGFSCTAENTCKWSCGQPPAPADPCDGLTLDECTASSQCKPKFGPSACTVDGLCTADMAYKGCKKNLDGAVCLSSGTCAAGEHCSTEDGVCNSYGMLAVCAGNCVANASE
jgi:hypothetical protein